MHISFKHQCIQKSDDAKYMSFLIKDGKRLKNIMKFG